MNLEGMNIEELNILKENLKEYRKVLLEKLFDTNKSIDDIDLTLTKISKPKNIEFGVSSINSEEIVKYN